MRKGASILLVVLLTAWMGAAVAQAPSEQAIRDVITRQLEAMNRDDQATAFAIASPAIQQLFGDALTFMGMVANGYPQVHHSRGHRFLKLEVIDDRLVQRVLIESEAGTVVARYEMIALDGVWRINGCTIEAAEGA
jgi:Domain of unknown function (DUF4864)